MGNSTTSSAPRCPRDHALELVCPAGDWESLRAAVANGADAVYFGLIGSSARQRATNFSASELPEVIRYLHNRNVRGYVTLNILTFSDELPQAAETARQVAEAGADAVIVQDVGLAALIHRMSPDLPIHASTQMSITDARGVEFAKKLGISRVILARELTLQEIELLAGKWGPAFAKASAGKQSTTGGTVSIPLEVFVHGALCISYSGQCLASEVLGGRSANRGLCAQACRLPYEIRNAEFASRSAPRWILSPHDLAAYDAIPALMEAGVRAFKIEGRLKSAPYVALATRVYREAIDAAAAGEAWALAENGKMGTGTPAKRRMSEEKMGTGTPARRRMSEEKMGTGTPARRRMSQSPFSELDMQQIFSRGFTHGYLDGVNHKALVDGGSPKNRGIQVGKVVSTKPGIVTVEELPPTVSLHLRAGDGIVFASGSASPEQELPGGRVYEVRTPKPGHIEISMGRDFDVASVAIGSEVWRTDDPALRKRLEATYAKDTIRRTTPLTATVSAAIGEPLLLSLRDDQGHEVSVASDEQLPKAEKHPVTIELLRQQLGRLGGTPFHLADVTTTKLDPVMARVSVLNDLRRKAVEELVRMREADARHAVVEPDALERMRGEFDGRMGTVPNDRGEGDSPHFRGFYVLVRTLPQLDSVIDWGATSALKPALVYCDFRDTSLHAEAVQRCRNAGMPVGLATLRVMMPGEDGFLEEIAGLKPDAVLVRNASAIEFFRNRAPEAPLVGDFSLNVANEIAADLMAKRGLTRITPGYDLSWRQLNDMLDRISPALFEVVLHAHAPMFHTRYCLLTAGGACRHACREARAELRDRLGVHHPIESDAGCRITIFNSVAQSACEYVEEMQERGVRAFRVELLRETARQTRDILSCYESLLSGPERGGAVWERLRHVTEDHVTRGTWKTE